MNSKEFSSYDLEEYVYKFANEIERENVLKQILESDILAQVFETTEEKIVLNSCVDMIKDRTMAIVRLCISDKPDAIKIEDVTNMAMTINVTYNIMKNWATILSKVIEHKDNIKKTKKLKGE